jgi:hypothetical protein
MEPVLRQALRTFGPYAERHGYELRLGESDDHGRPPAWAKVPFLRALLGEYDEVLWLDADLAILDGTRDIADWVAPDAYQALVEVRIEVLRSVNTGVWFLRARERTHEFLEAVWDSTAYIHHQWWENAAVLDLLGYSLDGYGEPRRTAWWEGTQILPEEWNTLVGAHGMRRARIRHYTGHPNDRRERWIRCDADRAEGNLRWPIGATRRWFERHLPRSGSELKGKIRRCVRKTLKRSTV